MFFKLALRKLWKKKSLAAINIAGLAIGVAACLLATLYIYHELSYDRFHSRADRIVRVSMEFAMGGQAHSTAMTGTKVAPAFQREFPEVESGVRIYNAATGNPPVVQKGDKIFREKRFLFADSTFFDIFSFPLLEGDPANLLNKPNTLVLTQSAARKYFGSENALGKTLKVYNTKDYTITGIVEDPPENSQIKFDFVASFLSTRRASQPENWFNANDNTYLLLRSPEALGTLLPKIRPFLERDMGEKMTNDNYLAYKLEPLCDVHLRSTVEGGLEPGGSMTYIWLLGIVAALILMVACVNYINLTTAHAADRAREIGLRKVVGARRKQLFGQFMAESSLTTALASLLGLALVFIALPGFNNLTSKELHVSSLGFPLAAGFVTLGLVVSLLAGAYPALVLSGYQPLKALRFKFQGKGAGGQLRKGLIVGQFAVSVSLVLATLVVQRQLHFMQTKKLGYDKSQILVLNGDYRSMENFPALKSELLRLTGVQNVTAAYETPVQVAGTYDIRPVGAQESEAQAITALPVESGFVKTLGLERLNGRDFSPADASMLENQADSLKVYHFMLNESAVEMLGWTTETAPGKQVALNGRQGEVVAVVHDFNFASLREEIGSLVIFLDEPQSLSKIMVKIGSDDYSGTLGKVKTAWTSVIPDIPFEYTFLDDEFAKLYVVESRIGLVFSVFAGVAIFLACLGLLGLAAFAARQRAKEIGIRKVLGATVVQVTALLAGDFLKLVLIAIIIACPIAWYAMNKWLADFAYRTDVSLWLFVMAGGMAIGIAFLTVSFQSIKAALSNPVKSLRNE